MKKVYLVKQYADCGIVTEQLQAVIDACAENGGGQIRFEAGTYTTATLELRSNIELYLDPGAVIRGADDCKLYYTRYFEESNVPFPGTNPAEGWYNSLICAYNAHDISIVGEGIIDGADCYNPNGEGKFRGPHGIFFYACDNVKLKGFTIVRCANYAVQFHDSGYMHIDGLKIYGGQDAIHFERSHDGLCENCDLRTGDDCICGAHNRNLKFINCKINTPGGAMMLISCKNLYMRGCKFWGPGEYPATFKERKRYSVGDGAICMLHDRAEDDEVLSDDWLLEDIEIENASCVLRHDRECRHMCGYQGKVVIDGIRAVNYTRPLTLLGTDGDPFDLTIRNGVFIPRHDAKLEHASFIRADKFDKLTLENITVETSSSEKVIAASNLNELNIKNVKVTAPVNCEQMTAENIGNVSVEADLPDTVIAPYVVDGKDSLYVPIEQDEEFLGARPYVKF